MIQGPSLCCCACRACRVRSAAVGEREMERGCPVHGGQSFALLIRLLDDGSILVRCRAANREGISCSETQIWEAVGLQSPQPKRAPQGIAQLAAHGGLDTAPAAGASGLTCGTSTG